MTCAFGAEPDGGALEAEYRCLPWPDGSGDPEALCLMEAGFVGKGTLVLTAP